MPLIQRLDHIELRVKDMEKALTFYIEKLELFDFGENEGLHFLGTGKAIFLVLAPSSKKLEPQKASLDHIAFSVNDIEAVKLKLEERGIKIIREMEYENGQRKSFYFLDPEGNQLEIDGPLH